MSGFVIATVYGSRLNTWLDIKQFLIRRFFRLYPLHLATLVFLVALEAGKYFAASHGVSTNSEQFAFQRTIPAIFVNMLFLQGLGVLNTLSWNTPSWSISCEMVAYILFAALGFLTTSRRPLLTLSFVVASYAWIICFRGSLDATFDIGVFRCLAGFFLGTLIVRTRPRLNANLIVLVSSIGAIVGVAILSGPFELLTIPTFAGLIYALRSEECKVAQALTRSPLTFLGTISFSIYLTHYIVISLIGTLLKSVLHAVPTLVDGWSIAVFQISPLLGDILIAITMGTTLLISSITYNYIEIPGRELGYILTKKVSMSGREVLPVKRRTM
jgi:peptidoglycan/LPS O-acetylase OafA/YrhL